MPALVLGPLLRYVDSRDATVWVETDAACEVEVLGTRARTFAVSGHHYAIVVVRGLPAQTAHPYQVHLDGVRAWPPEDSPFPPSLIRTLGPDGPREIGFGSCRRTDPEGKSELGPDALIALARTAAAREPEQWPDLLLMLGDQVYADHPPDTVREWLRARGRGGRQTVTFEEYARLYREAWADPHVRWLLSTVPTAMIFDDHEVVDDWNTSAAWREDMAERRWWREGIVGALSSYWVYQHLGNLPPDEIEADELFAAVRAAPDALPVLERFAARADVDTTSSRWSYARELGAVRLVVLDSRAGRVLTRRRRSMFDDAEWTWVAEHLRGDVEHLLIATSLPYLLPHTIHALEGWNEAVCDGAWGPLAARAGERIRRAADLEHWAAFRASFDRLAAAILAVARGERGAAPDTVVLLSGDIHCSYLATVQAPGLRSAVHQAVCSPIRNPLPKRPASVLAKAWNPRAAGLVRRLAGRAGVAPDPLTWRLVSGPDFRNGLMTLVNGERSAHVRFDVAAPGGLREEWTSDLAQVADRR
ncbi:MAG: alkaline phosphatase D family protein [Sporichthyaceae bacterium]